VKNATERKDGSFQGHIIVSRKFSTLKMKAAFSFKTSVYAYKTARCHKPGDNNLNNYQGENLRTYEKTIFLLVLLLNIEDGGSIFFPKRQNIKLYGALSEMIALFNVN
jgi:hypothetical protein